MPPHCLREIFFIRVLSGRTDFAPTENSRPARKVSRLSGRSRGFGLQTAYFRNGGTFAGGAAAIWGREGILWSVTEKKYAAPLLVLGCAVFGLGSLIVRSVPVGLYAIAFWRLLISVFVFWFLARFFGQKFPKNRKTVRYALTAGVFLAFDLALWHESIHAVGGYFHPAQQPANLFLVGNRCFLFRRAFGQAAGGKLDVGGCGRGDDCRCGIRLQR